MDLPETEFSSRVCKSERALKSTSGGKISWTTTCRLWRRGDGGPFRAKAITVKSLSMRLHSTSGAASASAKPSKTVPRDIDVTTAPSCATPLNCVARQHWAVPSLIPYTACREELVFILVYWMNLNLDGVLASCRNKTLQVSLLLQGLYGKKEVRELMAARQNPVHCMPIETVERPLLP